MSEEEDSLSEKEMRAIRRNRIIFWLIFGPALIYIGWCFVQVLGMDIAPE